MTDPAPGHRRHRHHRSRRSRLGAALGFGRSPVPAALLILSVVVVLAAAGMAFTSGGTTPIASTSPSSPFAAAPSATAMGSGPVVGSQAPSIAPTGGLVGIVAKRIRIARLGIDLRIVEGDGIDAPMNRAAHYPGTGWPGGGTNIYLYAHAQTGMFLSLWDVVVGDVVLLDLVDGSSRNYVVSAVKPKVAWNALQYLAATPTEQLTLQTSTSNTATAPRFVAIAEPAP